jgi:hypothetical protein
MPGERCDIHFPHLRWNRGELWRFWFVISRVDLGHMEYFSPIRVWLRLLHRSLHSLVGFLALSRYISVFLLASFLLRWQRCVWCYICSSLVSVSASLLVFSTGSTLTLRYILFSPEPPRIFQRVPGYILAFGCHRSAVWATSSLSATSDLVSWIHLGFISEEGVLHASFMCISFCVLTICCVTCSLLCGYM